LNYTLQELVGSITMDDEYDDRTSSEEDMDIGCEESDSDEIVQDISNQDEEVGKYFIRAIFLLGFMSI